MSGNCKLSCEHLNGDNYRFHAKGCPLKFFVIWEDGQKPEWNSVSSYGTNYSLDYSLDPNTTYNFHVYNGREEEDFRGKMKVYT